MDGKAKSASIPKADIGGRPRDVRFGPLPDILQLASDGSAHRAPGQKARVAARTFLFIVSSGAAMPHFVQGVLDDHILTSATDTAKKAFSAAIEWHIVRGFGDVSISDGVGSYSIAEFASMMALQEIAVSVEGERSSRS